MTADPDLAATSAGIAANQAQAERDERMRHIGEIVHGIVAAKLGQEFADRFFDAWDRPTKPGTPDRRFQDRVHEVLPAKLNKLAGEAP